MTIFSATKQSQADVPYPVADVWEALCDPAVVGRLTPFVRRIDADEEDWVWHLTSIPVLGKSFALSFTERMAFTPQTFIDFRHEPPMPERAGTDGTYRLAEQASGTRLAIDLTVHVDLPFPRLARGAVQTSMQGVLAAMGAGFARGLDQHLRRTGRRRR